MGAPDDFQGVPGRQGLETDPDIRQMRSFGREIGRVLVPQGPAHFSAVFDKNLLPKIPDVLRPPEVSEKLREIQLLQHRPIDFERFGSTEIVVLLVARAFVNIERRRPWVREVEVKTTPTLGQLGRAQKPLGFEYAIA